MHVLMPQRKLPFRFDTELIHLQEQICFLVLHSVQGGIYKVLQASREQGTGNNAQVALTLPSTFLNSYRKSGRTRVQVCSLEGKMKVSEDK